jgi:hypothetical protein
MLLSAVPFVTSAPGRRHQHQEKPPRRYSRSASPPRSRNRYNRMKTRMQSDNRRLWSEHGSNNNRTDDAGDDNDNKAEDAGPVGVGEKEKGFKNLKLPNAPNLRKQLLGVRRWASQDDSVVGTKRATNDESSSAHAAAGNKPVSALRRRIAATTSRTPPRDRARKFRGGGGGHNNNNNNQQLPSNSKRVSFASQEEDEARGVADDVSKLSKMTEADVEEDSSHWLTPQSSSPPHQHASSSVHSRLSSKTIVVGPWVDVLTADSTLFFVATVAVAAYPTFQHWNTIIDTNQVPMAVTLSWVVAAFAAGVAAVGIVEDWRIRSSVMLATMRAEKADDRTRLVPAAIEYPSEPHLVQEVMQEQKRNRHSIFLGAMRFSSSKVRFQAAQITQPVAKALLLGSKTWTSLSPSRPALQLWEVTVDPTLDRHKNNLLMTRLLRNPVYRRVLKAEHLRSQHEKSHRYEAETIDVQVEDLRQSSRAMGQFELPDADTLNEFVILPLLKLRGMDVFMTDDPETEVVTHPWLVEQGLRSVPSMVVNLLTPWANILIYLEMPSWVTRLSDFEIHDDDEDDVKALKVPFSASLRGNHLSLRPRFL